MYKRRTWLVAIMASSGAIAGVAPLAHMTRAAQPAPIVSTPPGVEVAPAAQPVEATMTFVPGAPLPLTIKTPPQPDPNSPSRLFGKGAIELYDGDIGNAIASLDQAIANGGRQARVLYFRGMAAWSIGDTAEAEKYFAEGARVEALDVSAARSLGLQMQRLQGPGRVRLEEIRAEVKEQVLAEQEAWHQKRYSVPPMDEAASVRIAPKADRLPFGADPFADDPGQLPAGAGKVKQEEVPPAAELPPAKP